LRVPVLILARLLIVAQQESRCKIAVVEGRRKNKLANGTVKWFNADKGYGFIQPADGGNDVFVHISQVQSSGLAGLNNDQPVEYELIDGLDGRQMAGNISIVE